MWALGGLTMVGFALLPSVWHWLRHTPLTPWQAAAAYVIIDATFSLGVLLFLSVCIKYGETRCQGRPAPYPGAWVDSDGHQRAPRGFAPGYLGFALFISLIIPSAVSLYVLVASNTNSSISRPLVCATLVPYLLVFVPQIILETKYLNRSFMTPVLPVLYMYYRLWQFIRSLGLVAKYESDIVGGVAASLLKAYLVSLLMFWVFDTACTMVWMPWMYDWQLQDPQLLRKLVEQRQQEQLVLAKQHHKQQQQLRKNLGVPSPAGDKTHQSLAKDDSAALDSTPGLSPAGRRMTTRSMARTPETAAQQAATAMFEAVSPRSRRRVVPSGSNNVESYGFGA